MEYFGNELLTWEGEKLKRIEKYDELVTEIESQYMQKIMKAPNRIHLLTIGEKLNNGSKIYINQQSADEITIYDHYENFLSKLGLANKYEIHTVNTYLLGLPLRTQIQILKQISDSNLNILNVIDAFVSDLYESGVDVELAKSQPKDFCNIAHDFLLHKELLNETYQLLPTSGSVNSNAVLFSLYMMFVEHSKSNPSMLFEYWITIGTIKNLLTIMPYRSDQKKDAALVPTIEGLSDYSFIGQNKVYRDICSYLSTYIRASLNYNSSENKAPWGGTLILKGLAKKAKKAEKAAQDRIDVAFKDESLIKRQLAFFPLSIASYAHKQQSIVIYSFYTLLGTIVELLKRYNVIKMKNKDIETNSEEKYDKLITDIYVLLKELSQVKDNVMPVFERVTNTSEHEPILNTVKEEKEEKEEKKELAKVLYAWMEKYPTCVPSHLIGKIATRAFYAMRSTDDKKVKNPNLGDAMHRRIVTVMNSILVEDAKENLENSKLSNNNPIESTQIFGSNLDKLKKEEIDKLHFSRWMLSCPLFLLYLNPNEQVKRDENANNILEKLSSYLEIYRTVDFFSSTMIQKKEKNIDNTIINWFKNTSIYNGLKGVTIYGRSDNKESQKPKPNKKTDIKDTTTTV